MGDVTFTSFLGLNELNRPRPTPATGPNVIALTQADNVVLTAEGNMFTLPAGLTTPTTITSACQTHSGVATLESGTLTVGNKSTAFTGFNLTAAVDIQAGLTAVSSETDLTIWDGHNLIYPPSGVPDISYTPGDTAVAFSFDNGEFEGLLSRLYFVDETQPITVNNLGSNRVRVYSNASNTTEDLLYQGTIFRATFTLGSTTPGTAQYARERHLVLTKPSPSLAFYDGRLWTLGEGLLMSGVFDYWFSDPAPLADADYIIGATQTGLLYSNSNGVFELTTASEGYTNRLILRDPAILGSGANGALTNNLYFCTRHGVYLYQNSETKLLNNNVLLRSSRTKATTVLIENSEYYILGR